MTGGIGSGKSEALAACRRAGAAVLSSDQVVHDLLETDEVKDILAARWGDAVLAEGEIDRSAVAQIVFNKPDELQWLEQNLFPLVAAEMAAWRAELEGSDQPPPAAVVEVPLLFEASVESGFDTTISTARGNPSSCRRGAKPAWDESSGIVSSLAEPTG